MHLFNSMALRWMTMTWLFAVIILRLSIVIRPSLKSA